MARDFSSSRRVLVQCLFQRLSLHNVGVLFAAVGKRAYARFNPFLIDMNDHIEAEFLYLTITKLDHFAKLPGGIDMHQGEISIDSLAGEGTTVVIRLPLVREEY